MGAEKITKKILADAKSECGRIISEAENAARKLIEASKENAAAGAEAIDAKSREDAAETERRRMLTASLDARKNTLSSRRRVLEQAFEGALRELLQLPDDRYAALMCAAVRKSDAAGDESVFVPERDKTRFEKLKIIEKLNDALKKDGKTGAFKFAGATDKIQSGALLVGETTDIDCSFEELLSAWREGSEAAVARVLFGGAD